MADVRERARRIATRPALWVGILLACIAGAVGSFAGCGDWDPTEPFMRNAPEVDRALRLMDAGELESAEEVLESYLGTGPCSEDGLGLPDRVRQRPHGSFDLGLVLFYLAEQFGARFGQEDTVDAGPESEPSAERSLRIDCAQIVVKAIAHDDSVPIDLRARAFYLSGNLEFLREKYEAAVRAYDEALTLIPGVPAEAGGDRIGADAAWNRAIALRRLQEPPDAGPDASPDSGEPDAGPDAGGDAGNDGGRDAGPDGGQDAGPDGGGDAGPDGGERDDRDAGSDGGAPPPQPEDDEEMGEMEEPPESRSHLERELDRLEEAPTYQEQEAKKRKAVSPSMEDK